MLRLPSRLFLIFVLAVSWTLAVVVSARAACNLIPQAQPAFRGALGTVDRPYAAPGDYVDVRVRASLCDQASAGIDVLPSSHEVTLLFAPPGEKRRAIVLTAAPCNTLTARLDACQDTSGMAANGVTCVQVNQPGEPLGMGIVTVGGENHLRFRFPDTDPFVVPDDDLRGLTGPVTIAVGSAGEPLPCGLATSTCAAQARTLGLVACVDDLYASDGTCQPNLGEPFSQFIALPAPNDFQADCYTANPPCTATATELRFALDREGNLLFPVHWQGVLPSTVDKPIPRLLRGTVRPAVPITVPDRAFLSSFTPEGQPLPPIFEPQADPTAAAEGSVTFFGSADAPATVLRIAHRRGRCDGGAAHGTPCNVDAQCGNGSFCVDACVGGVNDGQPCAAKKECGTGICGALYDADAFRALVADGGSFVVPRVAAPEPGICQAPPYDACAVNADCVSAPCVSYAFRAEDPVALESLTAGTDDVLALTAPESLAILDRNGDGDESDVTVTLRDRSTGRVQPLGAPSGFAVGGAPLASCGLDPAADGRAIVRLTGDVFTAAALATENGVVAFVESENGQGFCDENGDSDRSDGILRVFTVPGGEITASIAPPRAVDPALVVNGQSVVMSAGKVFFRTSEAAMGGRSIQRLSVGDGIPGAEPDGPSFSPALSKDGRWVAFGSTASNLIGPADTNIAADVFVRDRLLGTTQRVNLTTAGAEVAGQVGGVSISGDGRFVAFETDAALDPGDTGLCFGLPCLDIYVRDRDTDTDGIFDEPGAVSTTRVSLGPGGVQPDAPCQTPVISANGKTIVFQSHATNLVAGDTNGELDIFAWDRDTGTVERVDVADNGEENTLDQAGPKAYDVTDDGRYVVFDLRTTNLPNGGVFSHVGPQIDVFIRDLQAHTTEQLIPWEFISPFPSEFMMEPRFSGDGRWVVFTNQPDFSGQSDIWIVYREFLEFEKVNVAVDVPDGVPYFALAPDVSDDGRFVTFWSDAGQLVPTDANGLYDLYVRDRTVESLDRVNLVNGGAESGGEIGPEPSAISADGREVVFVGRAPNYLGPGVDANSSADVFVQGVDATDPNGVDALLYPDGALDDVVLESIDSGTGGLTTLCPAGDVAVVNGLAAFLRPEAATGTAGCPGGSLNGDADVADTVVQLWPGTGPVQNLGKAATGIALSASHLAALVSEAGDGATDLNGDGDATDTVLAVRSVSGGAWTSTGQAADEVLACGSVFALVSPEGQQGTTDLNGDGDALDRVAFVYVPATDTLINVGQASSDVVCSDEMVAFRTSEEEQDVDLIVGSGPASEFFSYDVMQGYDLGRPECLTPGHPADCLRNSHQTARACFFEACDPRFPYRAVGTRVKFLTSECEQRGSLPGLCEIGSSDLTGDLDTNDIVLQVFDVRDGSVRPVTAVDGAEDPFQGGNGADTGVVLRAVGRCLEPLGVSCGESTPCADAAVCVAGTCRREHRPCVTGDDCPPGVPCETENVPGFTAASPDTDDDTVPDHLDNCRAAVNPSQADLDGDAVGDACDLATCGDGVRTYDEVCESGSDAQCPGECVGCRCPVCGEVVVDPKAKVQVGTKNEAGNLNAKVTFPWATYRDEPITIALGDGDTPVIAEAAFGALPPVGKAPFKKWVYKTKAKSGVAQVQLQKRTGSQAGSFTLAVKAKKWFASGAANQAAAATELTVTVGTQCIRVPVTKKTP